MTKYIFVTGGVVSGLGKGVMAASLGALLKMRNYRVTAQKFDPYMNIDPGTMNPTQHGEVFVTHDGVETDLDLGHYERFIDENLTKYCNLTSGKVFLSVLNKERNGEYLGQTIQIIPHVTNEIKNFIKKNVTETKADIIITEVGGTIGDIEGQHFIEAIRQLTFEVGRENCLFIHTCLVPYLSVSDEYKSKPVQHSTRELQAMGIQPDIIVLRSDKDCGEEIRKKISLFCSISLDCVIMNTTADCLYEVPLLLHKNGLDEIACQKLKLKNKCNNLEWENLVKRIHLQKGIVTIALIGKYVSLHDSYLSIVEALNHASYSCYVKVNILWINSEEITKENVEEKLKDVQGVLIPGGFGDRGTEGMIEACRFARENDIPFLGICLGMQIAVIEFARNVAKIKDATSGEFDEKGVKVIDLISNQTKNELGGTMRLGAYPCLLKENTKLAQAYGKLEIEERHRHRYEFNNEYRNILVDAGLVISGTSPDQAIVETIELSNKRFFVGVQFHPEFTSRPNRANPIFMKFVQSTKEE